MVVRKDIDNTTALLTVTIARNELKPKLDAELKRLRQKMPVKGFRPGHVPMDYLKKMYGQAVFTETLNEVFSEELYQYLKASGLDVLGQPLPTEEQPHKFSMNINDLDPEYVIDYEVGFVPKFDIKGVSSEYTYERYAVSDLDSLAEEDLQYARKRMGKRTYPENDIQEGDMVYLSAKEIDGADGEVKEGGWETTISFLLSNIQDETFKSQLLQSKKGDTIRFNARSAERDDMDEGRYRRYILNLPEDDERSVGDWFEGTVTEVSRMADAELDGDFFADYFGGEVSNREEAIEKLKEGIAKFYDSRVDALLFRQIQEKLLELNPVELPEKFLKRWLKVTNQKLTEEQIEREFPAFVSNLRWTVLRNDLVSKYGIKVSDQEIYNAFKNQVLSYFRAELPDYLIHNSVERLMEDKEQVERVVNDLLIDKLLDVLKGEVTLVEKPITSHDLHAIIEAITAKAKEEQQEGQELVDAFAEAIE
jgi:trigger factor